MLCSPWMLRKAALIMPNTQKSGFADHPYASFVEQIEKPARYVGGEWGQVRKSWDTTRIRVCLAFPDIYDIGMSHHTSPR